MAHADQSAEARRALIEAAVHIGQDSPEAADRFFWSMTQWYGMLADYPAWAGNARIYGRVCDAIL